MGLETKTVRHEIIEVADNDRRHPGHPTRACLIASSAIT
jgi:hypothetical protein